MQRKSPLPLSDAKSGNANKKKVLCGKEALVKLLRWHFGYPDFRGKQLDAIQAVLSGPFSKNFDSCHDVWLLKKHSKMEFCIFSLMGLTYCFVLWTQKCMAEPKFDWLK